MAAADRLQRAAFEKRKSHEINHPFKLILKNQNLLRVKFLDCILREAEDTVVVNAFSDGSKIRSQNVSKLWKRSKRKVPPMNNMQQNGSLSNFTHRRPNLTWNRKTNQTKPTLKFNHRRFPRNSKSSSKTSNDPHKILEQYYAKYESDISTSKQKISKVFCNHSLNIPANNINQTWFNILQSLEKHLEEVRNFTKLVSKLLCL